MKIGTLEVASGSKGYEKLIVTTTRGGFPVEIPLHIISGAKEGKTLLLIGGVSGKELEPIPGLLEVIDKADPSKMSGNLMVIPLLNISGFEFEQVNAIWDDVDLHALGSGNEKGTVSEQLVAFLMNEIISKSDAVIEYRTGDFWSYSKYVGVCAIGNTEAALDIAKKTGFSQVLLGEKAENTFMFDTAKAGKPALIAWVGGGPGHRDFREEHLNLIHTSVEKTMKCLDILDGEAVEDDVLILNVGSYVGVEGPRGLTFMNKNKRGKEVKAGEEIGYVKHPFTGDIIYSYKAPVDGVMLDAGVSWPLIPENITVAIIGNKIRRKGC